MNAKRLSLSAFKVLLCACPGLQSHQESRQLWVMNGRTGGTGMQGNGCPVRVCDDVCWYQCSFPVLFWSQRSMQAWFEVSKMYICCLVQASHFYSDIEITQPVFTEHRSALLKFHQSKSENPHKIQETGPWATPPSLEMATGPPAYNQPLEEQRRHLGKRREGVGS